ncbi:hypothetical protein GPECTOR_11g259 [Gonium pectorale]|uniref:EamA domain-containing protein n=1 Tax=Gonium pectorale TaxID=33097 RepID=A0A150GQ02_GONPE|nr:hypothetical protein GPECTOR_11g259 [Gonium pectorale]|eukprot:KXZ51818.1 hypothetical protein GPECTOR_11g259 [Gonium pectorale]
MFGVVSLLVVAALWGSYSPVLKFLFTQPSPPSAALMTTAQALLAAAFLLAGNVGAAGSSGGGRVSAAGPSPTARLLRAARGLAAAVRSAALAWSRRAALRSPLRFRFRRSVSLGSPHASAAGGSSGGGAKLPLTRACLAAAEGSSSPPEAGLVSSGIASATSHDRAGLHLQRSASADTKSGHAVGGAAATTGGAGGGCGVHGPYGSSMGAAAAAGAAAAGHAGGGDGGGRMGLLRGGNLLSRPLSSLTAVGLELGAYNFFAVALGTWGVQRIPATKVAFLGQATSLITPLLVALSGQRVAAVVWGACCCGALGGALVALDGSPGSGSSSGSSLAAAAAGGHLAGGGHAMAPPLLAAAAAAAAAAAGGGPGPGPAWGTSRSLRLEGAEPLIPSAGAGAGAGAAGAHPALRAALAHSLPPAVSQESMGVNYVLASSGASNAATLARLLRDNAAMALVLWAGLGPGALSSYLQVLGQRIVPAAQAQMLYSSTPLWSALIARLLLRGADGPMGPLAWLGGAVMLSASLAASLLDALAAPPGGGGSKGGGAAAASGVGAGGKGAGGGMVLAAAAAGVGPGRWVAEEARGVGAGVGGGHSRDD